MPPPLQIDLLTLKMVSKSRVTWATSVPILVFLGLSVIDLGLMYARQRRRSSDVRRASSLNATALWGRRHNKKRLNRHLWDKRELSQCSAVTLHSVKAHVQSQRGWQGEFWHGVKIHIWTWRPWLSPRSTPVQILFQSGQRRGSFSPDRWDAIVLWHMDG